MEAERSMVSAAPAGADYGDAGPPSWNRASWDAFHRQYGEYPFSASLLPTSMEGAPEWVYTLMGLRKPPIEQRAPGMF